MSTSFMQAVEKREAGKSVAAEEAKIEDAICKANAAVSAGIAAKAAAASFEGRVVRARYKNSRGWYVVFERKAREF